MFQPWNCRNNCLFRSSIPQSHVWTGASDSRLNNIATRDPYDECSPYQDPEQYGEVVWRFAAEAAERAAEFRFHPTQTVEPQDDGSLIVRFQASGWLEMAWHLYQWGDKVEVLMPEGLRVLVAGHQRSDFDALP